MEAYYVPDLAQGASSLPAEEARHCAQVMRHRVGDTLSAVDGKGMRADICLTAVDRNHVDFEVLNKEHIAPDPSAGLHIAMAPPKQLARFEGFLEKATELGITRITPLVTRRSERRKGNGERWERIITSAMKQSQRAWLPTLSEPTPLADLLANTKEHGRYLAHCGEGEREFLWRRLMPDLDTVVLIGPEGDFDPDEIQAGLDAHFLPVSLGHARLRTETAGIAAVHMMNLAQHQALKA